MGQLSNFVPKHTTKFIIFIGDTLEGNGRLGNSYSCEWNLFLILHRLVLLSSGSNDAVALVLPHKGGTWISIT